MQRSCRTHLRNSLILLLLLSLFLSLPFFCFICNDSANVKGKKTLFDQLCFPVEDNTHSLQCVFDSICFYFPFFVVVLLTGFIYHIFFALKGATDYMVHCQLLVYFINYVIFKVQQTIMQI